MAASVGSAKTAMPTGADGSGLLAATKKSAGAIPRQSVLANTGDDADERLANIYRLEVQELSSGAAELDDPLSGDYELQSVAAEEFEAGSDGEDALEESLEQAARNARDQTVFGAVQLVEAIRTADSGAPVYEMTQKPEVADDFIRNYLFSRGLQRSLEAFQSEWYEFVQQGRLAQEDVLVVPDVYQINTELNKTIQRLREDANEYKMIANKAQSTWDRLRKQRDFHRMHHKRVVQEKNKLLLELKHRQRQYQTLEPALKHLQQRFEATMKEATLNRIDKEKAEARVRQLERQLERHQLERQAARSAESAKSAAEKAPASEQAPDKRSRRAQLQGAAAATTSRPAAPRAPSPPPVAEKAQEPMSPYLSMSELPAAQLAQFRSHQEFRAHDAAVSSAKLHPTKKLLATVSDDRSWKIWSFPQCELAMTGSGHQDWIADCDFSPSGATFATASGDATVKLWDLSRGAATATLAEHQNVVWSCAFDHGGDALATASMDHTARVWDTARGRTRLTLRGHADSVNQVVWRPYSSTVITCSGDKTVSLWDTRTGHCAITLYGHLNAVNAVATTLQADVLASCDADGVLKFWDWRAVRELESVNAGPYPANRLAFDPAGRTLALASVDKTVKVYALGAGSTSVSSGVTYSSQVVPRLVSVQSFRELSEQQEAVQTCLFDSRAQYLLSASSDGLVHMYS